MNTPTKITVSRICIIAVTILILFVFSFLNDLVIPNVGNTKINLVYLILAIIFVVASFTDFLDGYLARKNNCVTDLGKFLDPIADKLLVDSMLIFLLIKMPFAPDQQITPVAWFCVVLMISRDLTVDTMRFMAAKKQIVIAANIFGKAKTVAQMVAIPALLLNDWPFSLFSASLPQTLKISSILLYVATIASLLSGIIYVIQNASVLKETNAKVSK